MISLDLSDDILVTMRVRHTKYIAEFVPDAEQRDSVAMIRRAGASR
jgi:hypothetical protein